MTASPTTDHVEPWDVPKDAAGLRKLSPAHSRQRNDASLGRKVALVVAAADDPSHAGRAGLPKDHEGLRSWEDASQRLWSWSTSTVDNPRGRNQAVVRELHAAWDILKAVQASRSPGLAEQLREANHRIDGLLAHIVKLLREQNRPWTGPDRKS